MARSNLIADYDFLGFTYNGYHSIDDLKIYRTSDGGRYNLNITPTLKDTTATAPGIDGIYLIDSQHTTRDFVISFAFENLFDEDIRKLTTVFNGMELQELIFDEWPYKAYDARVSSPVQLNYICFDDNNKRVYKGTGTINFTCPYPYAHTPTYSNTLKADGPIVSQWTKPIEISAGSYIISNENLQNEPKWVEIDITGMPSYWRSGFNKNHQTIPLNISSNTQITEIRMGWDGKLNYPLSMDAHLSLIDL